MQGIFNPKLTQGGTAKISREDREGAKKREGRRPPAGP
jgi:hypothetical protein